jgi:hypothetical protein
VRLRLFHFVRFRARFGLLRPGRAFSRLHHHRFHRHHLLIGDEVFLILAVHLASGGSGFTAEVLPDLFRNVVVHRAGMRLLFADAEFRQQVQNRARLYLKFTSQLVDANLLHRVVTTLPAAPNAACGRQRARINPSRTPPELLP